MVFFRRFHMGDSLITNDCSVRPVFYFNTNVILTGGTGTESDPYRIA